jgi:hypothetical protein
MYKYSNTSNEVNIQANFRCKVEEDKMGWAFSKHGERRNS